LVKEEGHTIRTRIAVPMIEVDIHSRDVVPARRRRGDIDDAPILTEAHSRSLRYVLSATRIVRPMVVEVRTTDVVQKSVCVVIDDGRRAGLPEKDDSVAPFSVELTGVWWWAAAVSNGARELNLCSV